jgi:hypothetical protein
MNSNEAFAEQWAHLWDDSGEVDPSTAKPCLDIGSFWDPEDTAPRAEATEQQGAPDEK